MKLNELLSFVVRPSKVPINESLDFKGYVIAFLSGLGFLLLFEMAAGLAIVAPLELLGLTPDFKLSYIDKTMFLKIVLIGPVLEELLFRGALVNKRPGIIMFTGSLMFIISRMFLDRWYAAALALGVVIILIILLYKTSINEKFLNVTKWIYGKAYGWWIYISIIAFASIHMSNFVYTETYQYFIAPLLVVQQLIMGIMFSFVRIRYKHGLILAILMHIAINAAFFMLRT